MIRCEKDKQSSKDATKDSDKHSVIWGIFMSSTLQASVLMWKNYSDNWHSIKNSKDLTMKQMFDISEKLVSEQSDEIYGVKTIDGEPIEFEWNIFQGFTTLQLRHKVQQLLLKLGETPENFIGIIIFMSMFNDISCGSRGNEKEYETNAQLVSLYA